MVNFGCIVIAVIAIFLISVDLAYSSPEPRDTFFEVSPNQSFQNHDNVEKLTKGFVINS